MHLVTLSYVGLAVSVMLFPSMYKESSVGRPVSNERAAKMMGAQCYANVPNQQSPICVQNGKAHGKCLGGGDQGATYQTLQGAATGNQISNTATCPCGSGTYSVLNNVQCGGKGG